MNNNQKNEVIARYMGGEYHDYEASASTGFHGWVFPKATEPPNRFTNWDLRYNQSFDWLIPVAKMVYDEVFKEKVSLMSYRDRSPNLGYVCNLVAEFRTHKWDLPQLFDTTFSAITFLNQHKDD
jgi:hypothetical protein